MLIQLNPCDVKSNCINRKLLHMLIMYISLFVMVSSTSFAKQIDLDTANNVGLTHLKVQEGVINKTHFLHHQLLPKAKDSLSQVHKH